MSTSIASKNNREYVICWDSIYANPNGSFLDENKPRKDEVSEKALASPFRIKRYSRDYLDKIIHRGDIQGDNNLVFYKKSHSEEGNVKNMTALITEEYLLFKEKNPDLFTDKKSNTKIDSELTSLPKEVKEAFLDYLYRKYLDIRIYGSAIVKPQHPVKGPVQVTWSETFHKVNLEPNRSTSCLSSGLEKGAGTNFTQYIIPYACFFTYMRYDSLDAIYQNIPVSDEDLDLNIRCLTDGLNNYKSTSKNNHFRFLVEIIWKEDINNEGEDIKRLIKPIYNVEDKDLRDISEISFDFSDLNDFYKTNEQNIKSIKIKKHWTTNITNVNDNWVISK